MTDFELGAVGDCIVTRPLARQPRFAETLAAVGGCHALYGNLETVIFDGRSFAGSAYPFASDWPLASPPAVAADLATVGFDLVSRANNHALDWGLEGNAGVEQVARRSWNRARRSWRERRSGSRARLSRDDRRPRRAGVVHDHLPRDQRSLTSPRCGARPGRVWPASS